MDERRFAIIIGINDYDDKPLNCCVEDTNRMKEILIKKAQYNQQDIYQIISKEENSVRDITGIYLEKLREIKSKFRAGKDSILFYFAGHGKFFKNESMIKFHESYYPIIDIFKDISNLEPKIQIYIIDACESGGKVLTRSEKPSQFDTNILNQHIESCSGVFFLFACQKHEFAYEKDTNIHGLMTSNFLKALESDELYDSDGILTPARIQEFVAKNTSQQSDFNQIPVIENRITGYYPFAFLNEHSNAIIINDKFNNQLKNIYTHESRIEFQNFIFEYTKNYLDQNIGIEKPYYVVQNYNNLEETPISDETELIEEMVVGSREFEAINKIFLSEKKENFNKYFLQLLPISRALGNPYDTSEYTILYKVDFSNIYFRSYFRIFKSLDIKNVSFCLFFYVYQSKWGVVLTTMTFVLDWDGEKDSKIKNSEKLVYSFLINDQSKEQVSKLRLKLFDELEEKLPNWNMDREEELKSFLQSTSKP